MKKFRNLICLTALLFSFQTGISVSAEETDTQEMSEIIELESVIKAGDVNLDNNIDVLDVILLNRAILGKKSFLLCRMLLQMSTRTELLMHPIRS